MQNIVIFSDVLILIGNAFDELGASIVYTISVGLKAAVTWII